MIIYEVTVYGTLNFDKVMHTQALYTNKEAAEVHAEVLRKRLPEYGDDEVYVNEVDVHETSITEGVTNE